MALFAYKATTESGEVRQGSLSAASKEEVALELSKLSLRPIQITAQADTAKMGGLPIIEKITLCRYLSTMMKSGLSITETLQVLQSEVAHKTTKKIITDLLFGVSQGNNLSSVFMTFPKSFNLFFITLIKAGEASGTLSETFSQLEKELRAEHSLTQKIQGAVMYPAVVFAAMAGIAVLMFFFILPQIGKVFLNLNMDLPKATEIMFKVTVGLSPYKLYIFGGLVLVLVVTGLFLRTPPGKKLVVKVLSPIPAIRNLLIQIDVARFCRIFATLLRSGVPIVQTLDIALESLSYPAFRESKAQIINTVSSGKTVSEAFKVSKRFPPLLTQMISSGERSGTLDATLADLGEFYEEEVEVAVKKTTQLIEPVLMILVGIGVGIMVLSVIAPIYSVVSNFKTG